jgi:glycerate 2-kinase
VDCNRLSESLRARQQLLAFFGAGVEAVVGDTAVAQYFGRAEPKSEYYAISIGKAASAMLRGALQSLSGRVVKSLLITKHGHVDATFRGCGESVEIVESSHPVPDMDSLRAGHRLLSFIAQAPHDAHLLFLISGGTSSLVEVLPEEMSLADLRALNETLLAGGMDIGDMNRVRKAVSRIKGGRLAGYIGGRRATCLLVSDVPGDRVEDIGSGLLCRERAPITCVLDDKLADFVQASSADTVDAAVWRQIDTHIVASLDHAKRAVAQAAIAAGHTVTVADHFVQGDATAAGRDLAESLKSASPGVYVWGGETTLVLPENPGRGGRNQHLALAAAAALDGVAGCYLLCAGTDGSDGPTQDAGGIVDGGTLSRGRKSGCDWHSALARADSGEFLQASCDLLTTGPTGTNVMDLMIGLKLAG